MGFANSSEILILLIVDEKRAKSVKSAELF